MTRARALVHLVASMLFLSAWAVSAQDQAKSDKPAAIVNGETIFWSEVKAILDQRPSTTPLPKAAQDELRQAALDMLIDDMVMRQFLRKTVPLPDSKDIQKEIADLEEGLKKQSKTLSDFLKENHMSEQHLRMDIAARLQWKIFLREKLPDADLKKYYEANKPLFDKVLVQASHILVKVPSNATAADRQTYRAKLETLRQEIVAGKIDFGQAAQKYSDCPSKDKKGDVGHFPYKFVVVEPFAKAAFGIKKGEISDIVTTDFGYHLILVTDRTSGEPSDFEAIKESVRETYAQDLELYQRILSEQRKQAKIEHFNP